MFHPYPPELDDTALFETWRDNLPPRLIKVFISPDNHYPDHNRAKQRLDARLKRIVQPDLILYSGDTADLDLLSTFDNDPYRKNHDAFEELRPCWYEEVDINCRVAPNARQVAFRGNHTGRKKNSHKYLYITTDRAFVDIMRSRNRVWWIPGREYITIGKVKFRHGDTARQNEAALIQAKLGTEYALVSAHTHRSQTAGKWAAPDRFVSSVISGCGQNIPPHWKSHQDTTDWNYGVVITTLDPHGVLAYSQNIIYQPYRNGELFTIYGNELVTSEE